MPSHTVVSEVQPQEIAEVVTFVMAARAQMFPMLDARVLPADLADFSAHYRVSGQGRFLIARCAGVLVAAIGYVPYDHRFPQLDYRNQRVVEVVRLFVSPEQRRSGLAARLYLALRAQAAADGVQVLYLHTHPFLPGAIAFWHKQGFETVDVEADPLWQTTHMQCLLPAAAAR